MVGLWGSIIFFSKKLKKAIKNTDYHLRDTVNQKDQFLEAISGFSLYLFGYSLRFSPAAPKKDVAAIRAREVVCSTK